MDMLILGMNLIEDRPIQRMMYSYYPNLKPLGVLMLVVQIMGTLVLMVPSMST